MCPLGGTGCRLLTRGSNHRFARACLARAPAAFAGAQFSLAACASEPVMIATPVIGSRGGGRAPHKPAPARSFSRAVSHVAPPPRHEHPALQARCATQWNCQAIPEYLAARSATRDVRFYIRSPDSLAARRRGSLRAPYIITLIGSGRPVDRRPAFEPSAWHPRLLGGTLAASLRVGADTSYYGHSRVAPG